MLIHELKTKVYIKIKWVERLRVVTKLRAFAEQSQGPEFRSSMPTENLGVVAYICTPILLGERQVDRVGG